jgi:hypothetical protein
LCNKTFTEDELNTTTDSIWYEEAFNEFPAIIAHEYWHLYSLLKNEQIYGAL